MDYQSGAEAPHSKGYAGLIYAQSSVNLMPLRSRSPYCEVSLVCEITTPQNLLHYCDSFIARILCGCAAYRLAVFIRGSAVIDPAPTDRAGHCLAAKNPGAVAE